LTIQSIGEKGQTGITMMDDSLSLMEKMKEATTNIEKELIIDALNKTNWRRKEAAQLLGISRKTLYNKMEEYMI
jgi:DNA-binding NtrC family response regulator